MPAVVRLATHHDIPALQVLIAYSVRGLQGSHYTHAQMEGALVSVFGVDSQLIEDGTYYAVETEGKLAACGGWSKRRTLYGGDQAAVREDSLLDPTQSAARIRAFFVHPDFARRGIGSLLLATCEETGRAIGFTTFELASTLPGVAFYTARGYLPGEPFEIPMENSEQLGILPMSKTCSTGS